MPCEDPEAEEFLITADYSWDLMQVLNLAVHQSGSDILMLQPQKLSLEEIYLRITENEERT